MIIIIKMILIYFLAGALIYLYGVSQLDKEISPFKEELFLLLRWIFKPVIVLILLIDGYIIPTIKKRNAIKHINKKYNKYLKNSNLTEEQRQYIVNKRDVMIEFLNNVDSEVQDEKETY